VEEGVNVRWKTRIPGLGHASPIVWDERVFLTSAVSRGAESALRIGVYSEDADHPEEVVHDFRVYCLDRRSGEIIWEQTAHSGVPQVRRHIKSSHANCTPATDGKHVVAFFGSEGLYCYAVSGELLWKQDLGYLDAGAFYAPQTQWAFGSSPIIYEKLVIVQCDVNNQSFIAAYNMSDGKRVWYTLRDEVPSWGTPTIHSSEGRTQVIVNGYKHVGGYDALTGQELWRLQSSSGIPIPTPFVAHDLIFITSGFGSRSPIFAVRTAARGDISLAENARANEYIAWSKPRRGSYIPTPIVYGDYLYIANEKGILSCYKATSGEEVYRTRVAGEIAAYSASPIAADGKVYFTSEEGDIHVVRAGPEYDLLATNPMGEACLATPAVAHGMIVVRTQHHLFGIGK
jgi:outer membrane protein assembly factor BamB